jgi:non-ribosomal peptide synthase protein (TIGR01720 family)
MFDDDRIFDEVRFVDFYRYCDVGLDEMLAYLDERLPWVRPSDTGRATNGLINDVGIAVHKRERGFHNYAFPYSWDVRVGHKERDAALAELDDEIDQVEVQRILDEIGYTREVGLEAADDHRLAAYVVTDESVPTSELRTWLAERIPDFMVPTYVVRLDELPLTVNGKVDRTALPDPAGHRPDLSTGFVAPRNQPEQVLAKIWSEIIGVDEVGVRDNFFDLGGDSIMAIQIVSRANRQGYRLAPGQLFDHQTVEELARAVDARADVGAEQGRVHGPLPLTPVQQWFFEKELPQPGLWNHSLLLDLAGPIDPQRLRAALGRLVDHHDALRLRFERRDDGWSQDNLETVDAPGLVEVDLGGVDREMWAERTADVERELQAAMHLESGRLLGAALFSRGEAGQQLLLVVHHLAVDGVSWPILLEDLQTLCEGGTPPPKTSSFKAWSLALEAAADGGRYGSARGSWQEVLAAERAPWPAGLGGPGLEGDALEHVSLLDPDRTHDLLHSVPSAYHTQINEVLLAALTLALATDSPGSAWRVDLEGHGREDVGSVDVSRTVGWFTSLFPAVLDPGSAGGPGDALKAIKEQVRSLPDRGVSYGILRYLGAPEERKALRDPGGGVVFNFLGRFDGLLAPDSLFRFARPLMLSRDPAGRRSHALEVNAFVTGGELRTEWRYGAGPGATQAVLDLAARYQTRLVEIIQHCLDPASGEASAEDFPLANLDVGGFDKLARLLGDLDDEAGP